MPPKKTVLHFNDKIPKLGSRDEEGASQGEIGVLFLDWVKKMIVATAICGGKMMKCLMKC